LRFGVGDKVVYPNHGVGIIEDIKHRDIAGLDQDFYHLRILANETIVMVPVGNSKSVGLRKIFGKTDVKKLFLHLRDSDFETQNNWKGRYKENAEKMRSGHLFDMADVLKNLMNLSQKKALSYREKRMYEKAKYLIISEIAMVQGRGEPEVQVDVECALKDCIAARRASGRKQAKAS
jgi:CarD family transcriptional regulator